MAKKIRVTFMQNIEDLKRIVARKRAERDGAQAMLDNHLQTPLRPMFSRDLLKAELALNVADRNLALANEMSSLKATNERIE